jgi:hypothetical protein
MPAMRLTAIAATKNQAKGAQHDRADRPEKSEAGHQDADRRHLYRPVSFMPRLRIAGELELVEVRYELGAGHVT